LINDVIKCASLINDSVIGQHGCQVLSVNVER
jgi:hypothetical protein